MSKAFVLAAVIGGMSAATAHADALTIDRPETAVAPSTLAVRIDALGVDGRFPHEFSGYGKNISPAISWSGAPPNTRSFAVFVEDPDAGEPPPIIHWVAWNIAPTVDALPRAVRNERVTKRPQDMRQGLNSHGGVGWTGPHPPVGDAPHHYHVQVYALDRMLGLKGGAEREAVARALKGHVLAKGEAVGLFAEPTPKPAPR